jgi:hybrid cluster-associated redox disulfide protein
VAKVNVTSQNDGMVRFMLLHGTYYGMELTADSTIYDLLKAKPDAAEALFKFGMGCVGCAIARGETIREAAEAHGIPLPELLKAIGIKE